MEPAPSDALFCVLLTDQFAATGVPSVVVASNCSCPVDATVVAVEDIANPFAPFTVTVPHPAVAMMSSAAQRAWMRDWKETSIGQSRVGTGLLDSPAPCFVTKRVSQVLSDGPGIALAAEGSGYAGYRNNLQLS